MKIPNFETNSCLVAILTYLVNEMTSSHNIRIISLKTALNDAINCWENFEIERAISVTFDPHKYLNTMQILD